MSRQEAAMKDFGKRSGADATEREAQEARAAAEESFARLDRAFHALLGRAEGGLSPVALGMAWADWATHLAMSPGKQSELGWKAGRKWLHLMREMGPHRADDPEAQPLEPLPQDRRFKAPEWQNWPFSLYAQSFLHAQQWWHNATTGIHGVEDRHLQMMEFTARQFLDMAAPSNFLATNPQLIARTRKEGGANLVRGATYLFEDMLKAMGGNGEPEPSMIPGEHVALSPGKVVLRNELIELIQYAPTTEVVHPVPLLIVPAWIMKYYILDLERTNSLISWLVGQGFTVFTVSWKNPGEEDRCLGFDDYRELGVMAALDAVTEITGAEKVHGLGYCLGGTLLSVAAAAMARDGDTRLASLTMLAAQVDFTEAGELSLFTNEDQLALIEDMMWEEGYLDKSAMAGTFSMLKSKDLVWSQAVHTYLMGEREEDSALASWSHDATRMPYKMHSEYLRKLFLDNDLAEGRMQAGGQPVFLQDISTPVFAVATEADHIAPWQSVYKLTWALPGEVNFALVSGGHNTGIVAPPGSNRARYRLMEHHAGATHPGPGEWAETSETIPGSWWEPWAKWLADKDGGALIAPPPMGKARKYRALADAPGDYVLGR
ncbi:MAG: polyhydroxyalkanoic acid synthase [Thioclava marina]|nr:polyhydroxyalkanoic acid synthase [Thioclava marina]